MSRVRQGDKWLTPTQNAVFMAQRFKEEHGLTLKGKKIKKKDETDATEETPATPVTEEATIDQTVQAAPETVEAPTGGTEAPATEVAETPAVETPEAPKPDEAAIPVEPTPTPKKRGRPPKAK